MVKCVSHLILSSPFFTYGRLADACGDAGMNTQLLLQMRVCAGPGAHLPPRCLSLGSSDPQGTGAGQQDVRPGSLETRAGGSVSSVQPPIHPAARPALFKAPAISPLSHVSPFLLGSVWGSTQTLCGVSPIPPHSHQERSSPAADTTTSRPCSESFSPPTTLSPGTPGPVTHLSRPAPPVLTPPPLLHLRPGLRGLTADPPTRPSSL